MSWSTAVGPWSCFWKLRLQREHQRETPLSQLSFLGPALVPQELRVGPGVSSTCACMQHHAATRTDPAHATDPTRAHMYTHHTDPIHGHTRTYTQPHIRVHTHTCAHVHMCAPHPTCAHNTDQYVHTHAQPHIHVRACTQPHTRATRAQMCTTPNMCMHTSTTDPTRAHS